GFDLKQFASQITATGMLPTKPVQVGGSWPIEILNDVKLPAGTMHQAVRGNGTLQSVQGSNAVLSFDLRFETSMAGASPDQGITLNGIGKGNSSMIYDLEKARAVSNKVDATMDMTTQITSGGQTSISRSSVTTSVQLDLLPK
ncbi:MAG TPA: hypothetical protein VG778_03560, partial [Blastocatellia bacterium]|nr:hypothetical protein [Blastocatellia bacterium]